MAFLSLLLALALVQWWGSGAPVQRDDWFTHYQAWLAQKTLLARPAAQLFAAVLGPVLLLWALTWAIDQWFSSIWLLLVATLVLLYSLGRGDFSAQVEAYIEASEREDTVSAARWLAKLQGNHPEAAEPESWPSLHSQALRAIAYRGFERMFAVMFWFFILGPAGALLYRLSLLCRERQPSALLERWLWLLEWPVVRLMGLTWAMAGNFDSCFFRCQRGLTDTRQPSVRLLEDQFRGALGFSEAEDDVRLETIRAALPLFSRSLLLWVCFLALVTLLA